MMAFKKKAADVPADDVVLPDPADDVSADPAADEPVVEEAAAEPVPAPTALYDEEGNRTNQYGGTPNDPPAGAVVPQ